MIKASTITLHLSQRTIDLIDPTPTLGVAIAHHLTAIATNFAWTIIGDNREAELVLPLPHNSIDLSIKVPILIDATTHELLLRATLSNPSLTLSAAVDGLLWAHLTSAFTMISNNILIMVKTEVKPIPYGCLVPQHKSTETYWVWRYPDRHGKPKDKYLGKGLDRAVAKVRSIGIPADAKPQRLNKGKRLWAI